MTGWRDSGARRVGKGVFFTRRAEVVLDRGMSDHVGTAREILRPMYVVPGAANPARFGAS
jgi:hypothetical protein